MVTHTLAGCGAVGKMLDDSVEKIRQRIHALWLAVFIGTDGKCTQARKHFVKALKLLAVAGFAGIKHIRSRRAPDGVAVGVHLQEVGVFRGGASFLFLFGLFIESDVIGIITHQFTQPLHAIFRIEMHMHHQFILLRFLL